MRVSSAICALLFVAGGCVHTAAPVRTGYYADLVARSGAPEVPRYIKYRELDPHDPLRVLQTPTLQRGRPGHPIVLRRSVPYLYSVAEDGTFLVGERRPFATNNECGHPNLTLGRPARMSGELNYNARSDSFLMDNQSGRYGFQSTRRRAQLLAARALLIHIGAYYPTGKRVKLNVAWTEPKRTAKYARMDKARPILRGAPRNLPLDLREWRRRFLNEVLP